MRAPSKRFLVLSAVLVAVNVGGLIWIHHDLTRGPKPRLRVLSALPTTNVDETDRFVLVFDRPVAPADRVGVRLDRSPFAVDPPPRGYWQWATLDRLEYVLEDRLPPGRVWTVRPAPDLELQTGRTMLGRSEFHFRTRALKWSDCDLSGVDRDHVNFELTFNQPVHPEHVLGAITVTAADGRKLKPIALVHAPADKIPLRAPHGGGEKIKVSLRPYLTGHGGNLALGPVAPRTLQLPKRFTLLRAVTWTPGFEEKISLYLRFSHTLAADQGPPHVRVSPAVADLRVRVRGDNDLKLTGRFKTGTRYSATAGETVRAKHGPTLGQEQTIWFEIADRRPAVEFPVSRGVLSPKGNLSLDVRVANVTGLKIYAVRVHANNLVAHLNGACRRGTSRVLGERSVPVDLPRNAVGQVTLDLRKILDDPLGVYRVEARAAGRRWEYDHAVVTVTDLAITAKRCRDGYLVWVTSLSTGRGAGGVEVAGLTRNNQTVAMATTDESGLGMLRAPAEGPDGPIWVITALRGGDLSFLQPQRRAWVLDEVSQSGPKRAATYDVMLYTERGAYRPGETVRLTGVVRDRLGQVPPAIPLTVGVRRPDGRRVAQLAARTDPARQGMFHVDYTTASDGQTGLYRFTATLPGSSAPLGATEALVEAFVPVRMEVKAQTTSPRYAAGQKPRVNVSARYLFDQPAAGLPLTVAGTCRRVPFRSDRFGDYVFGPADVDETADINQDKHALDAAGRATVKLDPPRATAKGLWRVRAAATVTEPGGRSVSRSFSFLIDTASRHLGLRTPRSRIVPVGATVRTDWILLDAEGEPVKTAPVDCTLHRVEWDWSLQQVQGRTVWKSHERLALVHSGKLPVAAGRTGIGTFEFQCPRPGTYRLRIADPASGAEATAVLQAAHDAESPGGLVQQPERLEVVLDRDRYQPGSVATVLVRSPFAGTMLLTVETDRVIDRQVMEVPGRTATLELPVPFALRGGAFVTATVVRAVDPSADKWLPHRAMGMARLVTDHAPSRMALTIDAPARRRPGRKIRVNLRTAAAIPGRDPAMVHLWAVDEGVLLTTAYRTPDPLGHFLAQRRLEVATSDTFADLLPDHKRPASIAEIGAGEDDDEDARFVRTSPVAIRRAASAVIWSAAAPAGPDGTLSVVMDLPELTGQLRLMAVAVSGDTYGHAEKAVTVTAPLLVEVSLPRFAAPGDRFDVPVKLFNNTGESIRAAIAVTCHGPLQIDLPAAGTPVDVAPARPVTVWIKATATTAGQAELGVVASQIGRPDGLTAHRDAELTIRPAAPLDTVSEFKTVQAGKPLVVTPPDGLLPETMLMRVTVSGSPTVRLRAAIEQLIGYPYGCVEQTTSRLYGILYAPELLLMDTPRDVRVRQIGPMINAGIARLWSMQTRSGGLSYWPGGCEADLWSTGYAAGLLVQAKRSGYFVDKRFSDQLVRYLQRKLNASTDESGAPDYKMRALLCRVLAAFDKPPHGWMNRLGERVDLLDTAARAHLACAWLETGRKDRARAVLPDRPAMQTVKRTTSGRITSQVAQEAVLLDVLMDLDAKHPWVPMLAGRLDKARRRAGAWANTQENAMCLAALARHQTLSPRDANFTGAAKLPDGTTVAFDHRKPATFACRDFAKPIEIASKGRGTVYVAVMTKGLRPGGAAEAYDRRLKVRRTWTDRRGLPVDANKLKVGDLIAVAVTCVAPSGESVDNVAIVDALPAGLEVENPRLATSAVEADQAGDRPDRVEFLDDRVVLFVTASGKERTYRYFLRVTTAGTFALPPIQAACMYDPAFACINGGGRLEAAR